MVMTDPADFQLPGEVESSVQSTNQQHPDSRELPSLDRQSSIFSLTLDELQHTFSGDFGSFGSMNIDEFLNNILTAEEIQACEQTLVPNSSIAPSYAAPTAVATGNSNPQFPEGEIRTSVVNDTATQQSLLRQESLAFPSPLSEKTVDEVWYEIQKLQQEQEYGSTANVHQEVDSSQRQTTYGEMTLEDFLVKAGVVRGHDRPPSPLLQQSCVSYQNNKDTAPGSGPPGYMAKPVMASGGRGNVPAYQASPERSVKDAASIAVGRISSGCQPREIQHVGKMHKNAGGGRRGQCLPASPVSSDSVGANQSDSVNNRNTGTNVADKCSGPVEKVTARKQRRMIKNRESAARSRARRQAYTRDLEVELQELQEENARLRQAIEEIKKKKQQYMEELMKAHKAKDGKKGLKRSWSSLY